MTFSNLPSPPVGYETVVQALEESVKRNLTDGLLLSGGLDTTILAYLTSKWVKQSCITVALRGAPSPDIKYAKLVADRLKLSHYIHYFDKEEMDESIRAAIKIMKCFDPMEIRNTAAIYVGLKAGKDHGMSTIMTGDGGDELFGGYSFFFGLTKDQLDKAFKEMWSYMRFSSLYLAEALGIAVKNPFLDPQFKVFAMDIDAGLKIKNEGGQVWGKWILRKAFENIIPQEIAWRTKAPIEVGTGTTILPSLFDSRISDHEFSEKKKKYLDEDKVVIRSKEHLFYYEIYRSELGVPCAKVGNGKNCPDCGSSVEQKTTFCRTCGAYPI